MYISCSLFKTYDMHNLSLLSSCIYFTCLSHKNLLSSVHRHFYKTFFFLFQVVGIPKAYMYSLWLLIIKVYLMRSYILSLLKRFNIQKKKAMHSWDEPYVNVNQLNSLKTLLLCIWKILRNLQMYRYAAKLLLPVQCTQCSLNYVNWHIIYRGRRR